jgi:hypothetical protein
MQRENQELNKSKVPAHGRLPRTGPQRGNMIMYVVIFAVAWFAFFSLRSCIQEAKEKRDGPSQSQQEDE